LNKKVSDIDARAQSAPSGEPYFSVEAQLPNRRGRTGVIRTPHGDIHTPAFIAVATQASVKAVLPETMKSLGAQAVLGNAYHLYLRPGADIVEAAGGLAAFMNWPGPTLNDSGGFQVLSLGAGLGKVLVMDLQRVRADDIIAEGKQRLAHVDDDGVTFTSHIDGSRHRFTPELSMRIQHQLGADIIFAFDELTTLLNTRDYQEQSVRRTHRWAQRCMAEHRRLTAQHPDKPAQALFGVVQGAQYEDLRRQAARGLNSIVGEDGRGFDGYGIGGALEKHNLATIIGWVIDELPGDKPRHLLGISEPDDLFEAVAAGVDMFDCVAPSRNARNAGLYSATGRYHITNARFRRDFSAVDTDCDCYTCGNYSRAYIHHLFKSKELLAKMLCTIHNERFVIRMVDQIRDAIAAGEFDELRDQVLGRYYRS
jgi:queuine tRNA-ribosyltransferase